MYAFTAFLMVLINDDIFAFRLLLQVGYASTKCIGPSNVQNFSWTGMLADTLWMFFFISVLIVWRYQVVFSIRYRVSHKSGPQSADTCWTTPENVLLLRYWQRSSEFVKYAMDTSGTSFAAASESWRVASLKVAEVEMHLQTSYFSLWSFSSKKNCATLDIFILISSIFLMKEDRWSSSNSE